VKLAALIPFASDVDVAVECPNDSLADAQPKTDALLILPVATMQLAKNLENFDLVAFPDANSGVADGDQEHFGWLLEADLNCNRSISSELKCILRQINNDLHHSPLVGSEE